MPATKGSEAGILPRFATESESLHLVNLTPLYHVHNRPLARHISLQMYTRAIDEDILVA